MFKVETVEKFENIVRNGSERQLCEHTDVPLVIIFWLINNHINVYDWMDNLPSNQRELFASMRYELGTKYKHYCLLKEILDCASIMGTIEYCTVLQMKEKFNTMRIYVGSTMKYIDAINNDDSYPEIAKRVKAFEFIIDEMEDRHTKNIIFEKRLMDFTKRQRDYASGPDSDKGTVILNAINHMLLSEHSISIRQTTVSMDELNECVSQIVADESNIWEKSTIAVKENFDSITEAINKIMPR